MTTGTSGSLMGTVVKELPTFHSERLPGDEACSVVGEDLAESDGEVDQATKRYTSLTSPRVAEPSEPTTADSA